MKLRRLIFAITTIFLILFLSACEPAITGVAIATLPEKLLYIVSVDEELDLDGGTVYFLFSRSRDIRHYRQYGDIDMSSDKVSIIHEIDFTKEGTYAVEIHRAGTAAAFEVQVVTQEEYDKLVNSEGK